MGDKYQDSHLTIKGLIHILDAQMDTYSISFQKKIQQKYIQEGGVTP
ncbi:MAG: hypothetical protein WCJ39_02860 [bacterium]